MGIQILARLAALLELALTATVVVQATPVQHVTQSVPILAAHGSLRLSRACLGSWIVFQSNT
jgi:hypothetical protein